jgi:hypothetical protein
MKKTKRIQAPFKLKVARETVRVLTPGELKSPAGGDKPPSCDLLTPLSCWSETFVH